MNGDRYSSSWPIWFFTLFEVKLLTGVPSGKLYRAIRAGKIPARRGTNLWHVQERHLKTIKNLYGREPLLSPEEEALNKAFVYGSR